MLIENKVFDGLYVFEPRLLEDERGYFFEAYNKRLFKEAGIEFNVVQQNQSLSKTGTIRGLHYQCGTHPQAKFVRVTKGAIIDVAVDLRPHSSTYGRYYSIELSESNKKGLFIPQGYAHGFATLVDDTEVSYLCDEFYHANSEGGILYNDLDLDIDWMIEKRKVNISDKDLNQKTFKEYTIKPDF